MKKFAIILAMTLFSNLLSNPAHAALSLRCTDWGKPALSGANLGIYGFLALKCHDRQNNHYAFRMVGPGLGVDFSFSNLAWIKCPFVHKNRILNGTPLRMIGPKVSAAIGSGMEISIGTNYRGAACFIGGTYLGVGSAVQLDSIEIEAIDE